MVTHVRAGVIGLGVGEQHLRSYRKVPDCEVHAICDINPDHLTAVGERYQIARRFRDYREITEDPEIDVVSVCSYDDSHAEQVISALRHGKHVMVEKPVVLYRSEAEATVQALRESGKMLTSNLILRASPRFRQIKRMIDAGDFGDVFYMEGDYIHQILWKITEGWRGKMDFHCTVYGGGIHLIDLMRWMIGQEVVEVTAMGTDVPTRGSTYKWPDTIVALLKFEGGALAKCATTFAPQRTKFHALNVYGTSRTFVNDLPNGKMFTSDDPADETAVTAAYPGMAKGDLLPTFVDAIRTGASLSVDATDVFRVMDVCFAIWRSVERRETVRVDYLM